MIEIYRTAHNPAGLELEEAIKELVLAHRVIEVPAGSQPDALPAGTSLPALKDEGQVISGAKAVQEYVQELEAMANQWRKFQGDACYIDEDGEAC